MPGLLAAFLAALEPPALVAVAVDGEADGLTTAFLRVVTGDETVAGAADAAAAVFRDAGLPGVAFLVAFARDFAGVLAGVLASDFDATSVAAFVAVFAGVLFAAFFETDLRTALSILTTLAVGAVEAACLRDLVVVAVRRLVAPEITDSRLDLAALAAMIRASLP